MTTHAGCFLGQCCVGRSDSVRDESGDARLTDSHGLPCCEGVLIGGQKRELPAVNGLLVFNHRSDLFQSKLLAGILLAVRHDYEQDQSRPLRFFHGGKSRTCLIDGSPHGVEQCRGATRDKLISRDRLDRDAGMNELVFGVKMNECEERLTSCGLLRFDKRVDTTFRIRPNRAHGSTAVDNHRNVCQVSSHRSCPFSIRSFAQNTTVTSSRRYKYSD